jgi:acetolactate synthase I/II/III large subunit
MKQIIRSFGLLFSLAVLFFLSVESRTGGEAFFHFLEEKGIDTIYQVPGAMNVALFGQVSKLQNKPRIVNTSNELLGGFIAQSYGAASGKCGVLSVTFGPGLLTAASALQNACLEHHPLMVVSSIDSKSYGFKESFQRFNVETTYGPITKKVYILREGEQLDQVLEEAYQVAKYGTKESPCAGAVVVIIDLAVIKGTIPKRTIISKEKENLGFFARAKNRFNMWRLRRALGRAKRPVMVVGHGVIHDGAVDEIRQFVQKNKIPVATISKANGVFTKQDEHYLGQVGTLGDHAANYAARYADCLLEVGNIDSNIVVDAYENRFSNAIYNPNGTGFFVGREKFQAIDTCQNNDYSPIEIQKNTKCFLRELLQEKIVVEQEESWKKELAIIAQKAKEPRKIVLEKDRKFSLEKALGNLHDHISKDDFVVTGVGNHWYASVRAFKQNKPGLFYYPTVWASIGIGIANGLGHSDAHPHARINVIEGDGGFLWGLGAFAVASSTKYKQRNIKIFLFNDNHYSAVYTGYQLADYSFRDTVKLSEYKYSYKKLAETFGASYFKIDKEANIADVMNQIDKEPGLCFTEIVIENSDLWELKLDDAYFKYLEDKQWHHINSKEILTLKSKYSFGS